MVRLIFATLKHRQQTLMDANVLLLRLHHPDALLSHLVDDAENVDAVVLAVELLEYSVQSDEGAGPSHARRAVDDDGTLLGAHAFPEGPHEPHKGLGGLGNPEIGPRREMEVAYGSDSVAAHDPELGHVPVGVVALIHDGHLNIS